MKKLKQFDIVIDYALQEELAKRKEQELHNEINQEIYDEEQLAMKKEQELYDFWLDYGRKVR